MKDFAVAIIYGAALFVSIKYAWRWYNGELSTPAIKEWFGRGFFFAWGVIAATLTVFLIIRLITEYVK
ncbi:hypothetical protein [Acinetobacter baumannii]|uniref:hypothetical protein n=1 Tax=Acinetobacter baumannii TaxID=470 RepID=UPI003B42AEFC